MADPVTSLAGLAVRATGRHVVTRALPEEVPVAMVFDGTTQAVMMASPRDLRDFAHGFALTEGYVEGPEQIAEFELVDHGPGIEARFWLAADRSAALSARRRTLAGTVGCGLCGIDSLEQAIRALPTVPDGPRLTPAEVAAAPDDLRRHQPLHDQTHGVHAAGFLLPGQGLVLAREDVGRHNALDKLIGALALSGQPATDGAIVLTSRISVEMVQKCAMARCPVLIAVSAPTAHALRLAEGSGITVAAFARSGSFDIFSNPHRIIQEVPHVA